MNTTWREKYDRLKRWQARLMEERPIRESLGDDLYAFFECCYHLKDWLRNDSSLDPSMGRDAEALINSAPCLKICADIANGSKHLVRNRPARIDPNAHVERVEGAFQADAFQANAFQVEQVVVVADGRAWNALDIVNECVGAWDTFLRSKGLI